MQAGSASPVREDEERELLIEAIAASGEGIAHVDSYLVLVRAALPGERVRVKIHSVGRRFARATVVEVLEPSAERVAAACPHFSYCGGCDYQHLEYPAQIRVKIEHLRKHFELRLGRDAIPFEPVRHPEDPYHQRSKLSLHLHKKGRKLRIGLFQPWSRKVFGMEQCPVQSKKAVALLNALTRGIREAAIPIHKQDGSGILKGILLRSTQTGDRAHALLVTSTPQIPGLDRVHAQLAELEGVGISLHVHKGSDWSQLDGQDYHLVGPERLEEEIEGLQFLSSPTAFFQTSPWGAGELVRIVRELVTPDPEGLLVDLYCGGGLLSIAVSHLFHEVVGIEIDPHAVADAKATQERNGIQNTSYRHGAAEKLERDFKFLKKPSTVIVDPPRSGCDAVVLPAIAKELAPKELLYISCNPEALCEDIQVLESHGYGLERLIPLDMFPHTTHLEVVAKFTRKKKSYDIPAISRGRHVRPDNES